MIDKNSMNLTNVTSSYFLDYIDEKSLSLLQTTFVIPKFDGMIFGIIYDTESANQFWNEFFDICGIQTILNAIVAIAIYYLIIKQDTIILTKYIAGYGFIIPALLMIPFYLLDYYDTCNQLIVLVIAGSCSGVLLFRVFEAMYGTTPQFATKSLSAFVLYYALPLGFTYNKKSQTLNKVSRYYCIYKLRVLLGCIIAGMFLCSILTLPQQPASSLSSYSLHYKYKPFPTTVADIGTGTDSNIENNDNFLHVLLQYYGYGGVIGGHLLNNYCMASLFCVFLTGLGLVGSIPIDAIFGCDSMQFNNRPLLSSTSPSDFWCNRWNRLIHGALKRGIYIPMRKYQFSRSSAVLMTFIASGFMHEYILFVMVWVKLRNNNKGGHHHLQQDNYDDLLDYTTNTTTALKTTSTVVAVRYGSQTIFFLFNALIIVLETISKSNKTTMSILTKVQNILPSFMITTLVIMLVLPIGHWFTDEYVATNFYDDLVSIFPRLIWIS